MGDDTTRDALERCLNARLLLCDEQELRELTDTLVAIEQRRYRAELAARRSEVG